MRLAGLANERRCRPTVEGSPERLARRLAEFEETGVLAGVDHHADVVVERAASTATNRSKSPTARRWRTGGFSATVTGTSRTASRRSSGTRLDTATGWIVDGPSASTTCTCGKVRVVLQLHPEYLGVDP